MVKQFGGSALPLEPEIGLNVQIGPPARCSILLYQYTNCLVPYFVILMLLLFAGSGLHAQNDYLMLSPIKERARTSRTYTLLDYDSSGYYVLRFNKALSYAELEAYDASLKFKKTYVVTKQKRKYVGVLNIHNYLALLYFQYNENRQTNTHEDVSLYAMPLQRDSFALLPDSIELIAPFDMESNFYRVNFAVSPDRSKVLVYDFEEEGDIDGVKGLTNEITLRVFDSQLRPLWERTVNLSPDGSAKRMVSIQKLRVNNEGEVAIMTDVFRNQRTYHYKQVTADPTLFFVGKERTNFSLFKPNMGEYFFNQCNFTFDDEGNILWFGFYSKQRYYQQSGVFYIKINQARTKVLVKKRHDFTPEQLANILNRKRVRANAEARSYKLLHWRLTPKGHLVMSAEQQPSAGLAFRSNDVIAVQFDPEGDLQWVRHIYKHDEQAVRLKTFLEHYLCTSGNDTYILYNQGIYADGHATVVRIDSAGGMQLRQFYNYRKQQELFGPKLSFRLGGPEVFICFQDRFFSTYRFGLLNLKALFEERRTGTTGNRD